MTAAAHRRWLERMARESDRLKLTKARAAVREARAAKRAAKARARETCRAAKAAVRAYAEGERARLKAARETLRTETKRRRGEACTLCVDGKAEAEREGLQRVEHARAELEQERDTQAREKRWRRKQPLSAPTGVARARERKLESDDEVRANLSPDELAVWEVVGRRIKPGARMTRTEAFQHWLHENQGEVALILEKRLARELAALERAERAAQRATSRRYTHTPTKELVTRLRGELGEMGLPLDAVPF